MNETVRLYLIEAARQKDKFVFYSDIVRECGLDIDTSTEYGRRQLSDILRKISEYENAQQPSRPLLSSLAIYKDHNRNDHGDGFYKIAEQLGKGKFKTLKDNLFGFTEASRSRNFWQQDDNYINFASLNSGMLPIHKMEFFNQAELDFFKEWQLKPYDSEDKHHVEAKNFIMNTLWEKSIYLGKEIELQLSSFSMEAKKVWHKLGSKEEDGKKVHSMQFKHYTWIKIRRNTDKGKHVYFTFGIDARPDTEAFVYKIDCQRERGQNLTPQQIELCDSLIPRTARWNEIAFTDLLQESWKSLTTTCVNFIHQHINYYDAIIQAVYGETVDANVFKNRLIRRDKPKDGFESIPEFNREFKGVDVDFEQKAKEEKDLGDKGEALVKLSEVDFLTRRGMHREAAKVEIVKDGKGYDVLSYDENGNEKFIEVKTTKGNKYAAFFLTDNEVDFMRSNQNKYCIYRVYNYDEENNFGEFFELTGNVESQLLLKSKQYQVLIKKEGQASLQR